MSRNGPAIQFSSSIGFMMKFLVLFLATVALASASLIGGRDIDIKEDGTILIKSEDGKQIHITKQHGPYGQKDIEIEVTGPNNFVKMYHSDYNNLVNTFDENQDKEDILHDTKWNSLVSKRDVNGDGELLNTMTQEKQDRLGIFGKLFKGQGVYSQDYNQNNIDKIFNVLMKMFDRQVLKAILINQQQMYNQEIYGQYTNEKTWDMVLSFQGVFDHKYLVQILHNEMLRTIFVQQGLFNKAVLNQIFETYETEGVYAPILLEQLVNTHMLKQLMVNRGISVRDILEQTSFNQYFGNTIYNKDVSVHTMLEKIISEPMWRYLMVQRGIFNKEILDQLLYRYNIHGVVDTILLRQLVNKRALYTVLAQHGIVDENILRRFMENEFIGLNYLYRNNFFQTTPRMTYNNLFRVFGNVPEFGNMQMDGGKFLRNMLYGYNAGPTTYGRFYHQYPLTQRVY